MKRVPWWVWVSATPLGLLIILGWCGAVATSLSIRPAYLQAASSAFLRAREAAERRLEERRDAQRLAAEQPALALELGIGRPDRPGAQAADGHAVERLRDRVVFLPR